MSHVSALAKKYKYSLGIVGLCLVAAMVFDILTSTSQLWLGFIVAAAIYMPGAIFLDRLRIAAEQRATEQELINRVLH